MLYSQTEKKLSRAYRDFHQQAKEKKWARTHHHCEVVSDYPMWVSIYHYSTGRLANWRTLIVYHNPDGLSCVMEGTRIAQLDSARSPLLNEALMALGKRSKR